MSLNRCLRTWQTIIGFTAAVIALAVLGAPEVVAADNPAAAYVSGIEALDGGEFVRAAAEFDRALAGDQDNADYLRARGVARTLGEQFPGALADLQRAIRLNANDRESRLWLAAAFRMSGDPATGAQYFTFTDLPKDYANLIYNLMAMDYWQSREAASRNKKLFPDAARLYAQRHMATGPAATALVTARMKAALDRGDATAALKDLLVLRRTAPDDAALRGDWARCLLGLGDAWHAREEFTHALCLEPLWAEGYAGRAKAAALLGDDRRVTADLEAAKSLGLSANVAHPAAGADNCVAEFAAALEADATDEVLADKALAVRRWFNAHRLRYDESYQDRIWALSDAARQEAKNPNWPEALGRFLFNHQLVPTIWNGPRATEQLRPQSKNERAAEFQRALDAADAALRLDPRTVNAIATKADIFFTLGNVPEAERLADQGLAIEHRNLRLLHRKTRIVADRAATLEAQAGALRAGRSETHQETRSDGVYQVTTHYPPTAADLAQAAELEKQAAACRREANQLSAEADKVESVTIPALVNVGNAALRSGNLPAAARAFNEASRLDPDRTDVLKGQAEVATRQGNTRAAKAFTLLATPLEHSTAASKLQTAWNEIVRTASQNAGELLEAAAKIDPSEARVPAYRAIIAAGRGDAASAAKQRRAALALEEARARLMGTSFLAANAVPLRVEDVALTLAVRRQFAETLLTANNASAAVAACDLNTRIESRFDKFALTEFAPTALLPDTSEPNTIPDSPSLASLLAWSHLDAGRALLQLAKPDEALRHYRTVLAYNAGWPATAPGRETVKIPCGWAQLGLVEAAIAAKDFDTANRMVMDQNIVAWGLPRELEQRRKALQQQISDARQNQYQQQRDADARLTPRQMQARGLRDELARYQQQRDAIARELDRPGQNERTQQVLRSSIAELDRMIANDKARLGGLEQSP